MAATPAVSEVYASIGTPNKRYKLVKPLSRGKFGAVFQAACYTTGPDAGSSHATSDTSRYVAIKFVAFLDDSSPTSSFLKAMVRKEILISNHLSAHPHVVGLRDLVVTQQDPNTRQRQVGIVMPLGKRSLQEYANKARTKPLQEPLVRWWFQQVVLAVDHCHTKDVGQRDIKPGNILVFEECPFIRLADFGLSKQLNVAEAMTEVGTGIYMAPDIPEGGRRQYDAKKADVWSCGVVLFQLLFPNTFEEVKSRLSMEKRARYKDWALHLSHHLHTEDCAQSRSEDVVDLLRQMLQEDPSARLSMSQVMEHRWFMGAHTDGQVSKMPTPEDLWKLQQAARGAPPVISNGSLLDWIVAAGLPADTRQH